MNETPWTWEEFCKAMRQAGWRLRSNQGFFEHKETGCHFNPFNFSAYRQRKYGNGEAWHEFARLRETPTEAPF